MVRIGIIGAGKVVQNAHLPGFSPRGSKLSQPEIGWYNFGGCNNGKVISLCDKNINRAKTLAEKYDIPHVYEDWGKVVNNKEIDAVCVATPNYLHHEIAIAAAEAGKHILVEKPIACSLEDADEMIQTASNNNVIFMIQQTFRFLPAVDIGYRIVNNGILGKVFSIKGSFCTPGPDMWAPGSKWFFSPQQAGFGALLDVGIHAVDLVRYFSGKNIREITAMGGSCLKDIDLDDNAICMCKFEDDTFGIIEASWTSVLDVTIVVRAEKGTLKINIGDKKPVNVEFSTGSFKERPELKSGIEEIAGIQGVFERGKFFPNIPSETKYHGPFQYFINCILNKEKPFISGEEGRADLEILLAGYEAMKGRCFVSLPLSL